MTETVAQGIERVRRVLRGRNRVTLNRLDGAITSTATTLVVEFAPNRLATGSQICIGLEMMLVWDVDTTTKTLTVERGMLGSTAAAHSDGDHVEIAPRFPRFEIYTEMRSEILSWPKSLYRVDTWTLDAGLSVDALDIPNSFADTYGVIAAYKSPRPGEEKWARLSSISLMRALPPADSKLMVNLGECTDRTSQYQLVMAMPFDLDEFDLTTDLIEDVGLTEPMLDIVAWGVAGRLLLAAEADRTDSDAQGLPRLAEENPPGQNAQLAGSWFAMRERRLVDETARLIREWPIRYGA